MNRTSYRVLCRVDRIDGDVMYLDIPGYTNAPFSFYVSAVDNSELVDLIEQDYNKNKTSRYTKERKVYDKWLELKKNMKARLLLLRLHHDTALILPW